MMQIFEESKIRFQFDAKNWQTKRFDAHRFYKTLSGSGLKGVDFMGIYQSEKLLRIMAQLIKSFSLRQFKLIN